MDIHENFFRLITTKNFKKPIYVYIDDLKN